MKLPRLKFTQFIIFNLLLFLLALSPFAHAEKSQLEGKSPYASERKHLLDWLEKQMVPNVCVLNPPKNRKDLILSYMFAKTNPDYEELFSKSSLYDNAVAVIAFCVEERFDLAKKIIDAIIRLGGKDAKLFFTFNTHDTWPGKDDNFGAIIRSGASAWAGQAIVFYIRAQMLFDTKILNNYEVQEYLKYAELIADNILKRMVLDNNDERYGLITGGSGTYALKHNIEKKIVEETFVPGEISWCSIEHNIDMYFFLKDLGKISDNTKYRQSAELIKNSLIAKCWNDEKNQFNRGHNVLGADTAMALDCASWGALFLKSNSKEDLLQKALKSVKNYESSLGYRPYKDKPVYETYDVGKFYFPKIPKRNWNDFDFMWTEGALGAALAYNRTGKNSKAKDIVNQVLEYQSQSGGIRYASKHIPHEFSTEPSTASTAWLLIVLGDLEDNKIAKLFWK